MKVLSFRGILHCPAPSAKIFFACGGHAYSWHMRFDSYARRAQPRLKTASLEIFILGLRSAVQLLCCSLRLCSSLFLCGIVWATVHIRGHGASMDVRVRHVCGCLVCRMHWRLAMDRSALAHQCCSARIPLVFGVWASIRPRTHGSAQASGPHFSAESVN